MKYSKEYYYWKGYYNSVKRAEMKIRPVSF